MSFFNNLNGFISQLISAKPPALNKITDSNVSGSLSAVGNQELYRQIYEIQNKYKDFLKPEFDIPEIELEEMTYDAKSDEEIEQEALNSLVDYKVQAVNKINDDYADTVKALEAGKSSVSDAVSAQSKAIEEAYNTAKENASNEILKRGLGRSSIAAGTISTFEQSLARDKVALANALAEGIIEIDNQIAQLDAKRSQALRDFDVTYAAKLAIAISDLKDERTKRETEVLQYNNTIAEKERDYVLDKLKAVADLTGKNYDNIVKEYDAYKKAELLQMNDIYQVLFDSLAGYEKMEALRQINEDPVFRHFLNDEYLEKLRLAIAFRG